MSVIPGWGRSPGGGNGKQGNPMDRGAWQATVPGVTKSRPDRLSTHTQEQRGRAGEIHILPPSPSAPLYQGHLRVGGWLPQPCHPL